MVSTTEFNFPYSVFSKDIVIRISDNEFPTESGTPNTSGKVTKVGKIAECKKCLVLAVKIKRGGRFDRPSCSEAK
jgi:hypothetical protein